MKSLFVTMEKDPRETRGALIPSGAQKLSAAGWEVNVESGAGVKSGFSDADYQAGFSRTGIFCAEESWPQRADFQNV